MCSEYRITVYCPELTFILSQVLLFHFPPSNRIFGWNFTVISSRRHVENRRSSCVPHIPPLLFLSYCSLVPSSISTVLLSFRAHVSLCLYTSLSLFFILIILFPAVNHILDSFGIFLLLIWIGCENQRLVKSKVRQVVSGGCRILDLLLY